MKVDGIRQARKLQRYASTAFSVALLLLASAGCAGYRAAPDDSRAATPTPPVTFVSPPAGSGSPFGRTAIDLASKGYVEEEFLASGRANRYRIKDPLTTAELLDGGHAYTTRLLVRRPTMAAKFNGTVIIEWFNVTASQDVDFVFAASREHLLEQGYVWVGVSAQLVGINALRATNPARYAALSLTASNADPAGGTLDQRGDVLSWDVYAQIAGALRAPGAVDPLGGLKPRLVVAAGESQSAFRLTSYYNAIQPFYPKLFDGFLTYDRVGRLRTDIATKHLSFGSEFLHNFQGAAPPDASNLRVWELAGASHVSLDEVDSYLDEQILRNGVSRSADGKPRTLTAGIVGCANMPAFSRVPNCDVLNAGLEALMTWITKDKAPSGVPRFGVDSQGKLSRDSEGRVSGGIRLAAYDVPIAKNLGANTGSFFCELAGSHHDFTPAELCARYSSGQNYAAKVVEVTRRAQRAGFLLESDANRTIDQARNITLTCP
jgi:hypothetical protein